MAEFATSEIVLGAFIEVTTAISCVLRSAQDGRAEMVFPDDVRVHEAVTKFVADSQVPVRRFVRRVSILRSRCRLFREQHPARSSGFQRNGGK
jgi:hypothetical protein